MPSPLSPGKETPLIEQVVQFTLSADLSTVAVLCDEDGELSVRVYEAGEKPPDDDDDDDAQVDPDKPGEASGLVDVASRVTLVVDRPKELRQMFYEGWAAALRYTHPSILEEVDPAAILAAYEQVAS